ncbi:MAG TPA: DNA polymerase III subunit delta [Bacillota bacterium]|nr:DNA polymerase III subunit delta [Bacillota bacterium]HQD51657.1 DNA polymerase III subunit delta [Bacillota bacterium]
MATYREAVKMITAGRFAPAYLFYGDEFFLIQELTDLLSNAFLGEDPGYGREKVDGDKLTLGQALRRLDEPSLFAPRKLLLVEEPPYLAVKKRESQGATGEKEEQQEESGKEAAAQLESFLAREKAQKIPSRIILFRAGAVDRRRRLFKLLEKKAVVVQCAPLRGGELARWIRERVAGQGKKIEPAALQRLLWSGENDLYCLSNELDKYSTYLGEGETTITAGVVEMLFSGDIKSNVFTLTDALSEGNLDRALQALSLLARKREEPLRIFFMLVRHFRLLLGARSLREEKVPPAEHPRALGVTPFEARKVFGQSAAFSREILEEIIILLQKIDYQIKTGRVAPWQALEIAIAQIHQLTPCR